MGLVRRRISTGRRRTGGRRTGRGWTGGRQIGRRLTGRMGPMLILEEVGKGEAETCVVA
jgi:hypothetical protein